MENTPNKSQNMNETGAESVEKKAPVVLEPKKKTDKTPFLIGVIVVLALCLAGAVTYGVIVTNRLREKEEVSQGETGKDETDKDEPTTDENKLEELALDNALVQRLYHNFDGVSDGKVGGGPTQEARFYVDESALSGNPSNGLMAGVAIEVVPKDWYCKGWLNGDYSSALNQDGCYNGQAVRRKVKEMFGKDVEFLDGERATSEYCGSYLYSAKNDEFYTDADGCGGSGGQMIDRELYKAERDGNRIYLYEMAVVNTPGALYRILEPNAEGEILDENKEVVLKDGEEFTLSGYSDEVDHFKWTFEKTADGDYAFTGLEKVE